MTRYTGLRNVTHDWLLEREERLKRLAPMTPEVASAFERVLHAESPPIYERDVLSAVLDYLAICPRVAWFARMNVGQMTDQRGHVVRFAFKGCSDIIGQLKDGRFLAIECKRPGKNATSDQWQFLCNVNRANGVGLVACSVDDVIRGLKA